MRRVGLVKQVPGTLDRNRSLAFACDVEDCGWHYDIINGYHRWPGGKIERSEKQAICPKDGLPMFVAHHEPQGSIRRYQCSQIGCVGSKEIRGEP